MPACRRAANRVRSRAAGQRSQGPKAGATKDYAFFLLAQAAKYLVAQAFSIASHIEIIKEYKTALASMVFNAFCGASPAR
jgi:hypothetical protein